MACAVIDSAWRSYHMPTLASDTSKVPANTSPAGAAMERLLFTVVQRSGAVCPACRTAPREHRVARGAAKKKPGTWPGCAGSRLPGPLNRHGAKFRSPEVVVVPSVTERSTAVRPGASARNVYLPAAAASGVNVVVAVPVAYVPFTGAAIGRRMA